MHLMGEVFLSMKCIEIQIKKLNGFIVEIR
jgi:hypothetical protein